MRLKKLLFVITYLTISKTLIGQVSSETFKPSGKPILKVFADWHQGFGNDNFVAESGFEATRALIGYKYQFSPFISTKFEIDTDNPSSGKLTEVAYLKTASLNYKRNGLSVSVGVIGMKQFKAQESNWGYRYIFKSAMDYYKFNSSSDLGVHASYKFSDWLSADVTVTNGEGAKKQQDAEGKYRTGAGLSLSPVDGLLFRAYYDLWFAQDETPYNQSTYAFFLGYVKEKFRLGVEYNILYNYDFEKVDDRHLFSAYGTYCINDKFQVFGRYDYLYADYASKTEYMILAGFDYNVVKGVKISPNYRYGDFAFSGVAGEGSYLYVNLEYKF